ncbi:MAG: preprotein translocase subunit YajC [Gammaproteobacteria bacterium RIFCSPHIGHO2_12_FULL_41_20]|nr:MAG: preprotein translocase subunit YajC [Gammaproteobacteria bacterium RIFCSPHIGHO2_12_FULL_41_20]
MTLFDFFISSAYAADASVAGTVPAGGSFSFFIIFAVFILFFYFAIWRPQNKRNKEQRDLLGSLAKGDEVITVGGVLGKIGKISDQYVVLTIADNTDIVIQKSAVVTALPKGTLKSLM